MTTDKQAAANKANAQKSSGPKTSQGKEIAARNAKEHGLTTSPDWQKVTSWYRIIMANTAAKPDPLSTDRFARAGLALAEAEAANLAGTVSHRMEPEQSSTLRNLEQISPSRATSQGNTLRNLKRYRREAEARRRKALTAWTELLS